MTLLLILTAAICVFAETRMKPTDIWTNHPNPQFKPCCHNGDKCHTPAPRGSKTGTQGLKGSIERSKIPEQLCEHIVDICERYFDMEPVPVTFGHIIRQLTLF